MKKTVDYAALPAKVSNQTLKMVEQNFKSFFALKRNDSGNPKIPNYLDKENGRYLVTYEKQALHGRHFKKTGELRLSKTNIFIKTQLTDFSKIKEARIVPKNGYYVIEIVYDREIEVCEGEYVAALDPGMNNLATVTFSSGEKPIIINGRPLKAMNQFYNKENARLQSEYDKKNKPKKKDDKKKKRTKRQVRLTNKRNHKVQDYMHKASHLLANQLVSNHVKTLVIGKNVGQKQDINIGKVNNQNFTCLPLFKFLNMVAYKARLKGIEVVFEGEAYTSKSSFLNLDPIPEYGDENIPTFSGYREKRGMYKIKGSKRRINADVNGSYNIMRKVFPKIFSDGIEGFAVTPIKFNI